MRTLYGSSISPFVRKVAVVLDEKELAYDWKQVRPHDPDPEFQKLSPLGKIPAYRDEHTGLADSSVISFYLEKRYPSPALYPSDTDALVRALWFEEFFDGGLFPVMGTVYLESFMNPSIRGKATNHEALKEARETKLPPLLDYLESQLGSSWIADGQFSIADISIGCGFVNFRSIGIAVDTLRYPKLAAYIDRILERPSFVKTAAAMATFIRELTAKK